MTVDWFLIFWIENFLLTVVAIITWLITLPEGDKNKPADWSELADPRLVVIAGMLVYFGWPLMWTGLLVYCLCRWLSKQIRASQRPQRRRRPA